MPLCCAQLFTSPQPPPLWDAGGRACVSLKPSTPGLAMMTADKQCSPLQLQVGANADILDRAL
jgi:hypothetical protein